MLTSVFIGVLALCVVGVLIPLMLVVSFTRKVKRMSKKER